MTALPGDLAAALDDLAALARAGRPVLLASDFDGVLAELVDDPEASRPVPAAAAALARLAAARPGGAPGGAPGVARPDAAPPGAAPGAPPGAAPGGVTLALVSGRDLATLARLAGAPAGTVLVGSHGAERGVITPDGALDARPLDLAPADAERLAAVVAALEDVAARAEGAWVERKPTSAVLHVRLVPGALAEELRADALARLRALGADAMLGKDVVDCGGVETSKGAALTALREETGAARTLYLGDDVTDERAFAALGPDDVTVRVGDGASVARFRVAGTAGAAAALARVADALERRDARRAL